MEPAPRNDGSANTLDVVMGGTEASHQENDQEAMMLSKKRKSAGKNADEDAALDVADGQTAHAKKAKLDAACDSPADRSALPTEVWHHLFTFCPPRTLGNLLSVNKLFNSYLDPASSVVVEKPPSPLAKSAVKVMEPNAIWRSARRSFWPNMPGPLRDKTELDMWRLSCSSTCQFCGKRDTRRMLPASDPFRFGPGADGVARIWEFRVRCCGSCLSGKTLTEMDLVLSAASTFLIPALPFVFVTSNSCVIPLNIIERGLLPPSSTLTKLFWSSDVESLREEFASVREIGAPAAEEWQKGLSTRGSDQRADIAKWEKYADSGGVANMRTLLYPGFKTQSVAIPDPPQSVVVPAKAEPTQPPMTTPVDNATSVPAEDNSWDHLVSCMITQEDGTGVVAPPLLPFVGKEKTKEEIDAEWDIIQGPVRLKILKYADEAIIGDWDDGEKVTKDNAPAFAVDVLLHVRKRFYMEVEKDAKAARAAGRQPIVDPFDGPFTQKLSLENMKYVFDVKVKPISSKFRKELFLCPSCDANLKFFGFEGVIQHYAAKHTTILSVGNIVVHWRSEWPEDPPFRANPRVSKTSGQPLPLQQSLPPKPPNHRAPVSASTRLGQGYQQFPAAWPPALQPPLPPVPPFQQGQMHPQPFPVANNIGNGVHYGSSPFTAEPRQPLPLGGPSYPQTEPPAYQPPPFQLHTQPTAYQPYIENADQAVSAFPVDPNAHPVAFGAPASVLPAQILPPPVAHDPYQNHTSTAEAGYAAATGEKNHILPISYVPYHIRLDETARHAHQIWNDTTHLRHLPGVVKVFTLLYHANKFYRSKFGELLPLYLFTEGLSDRKEMRPIRSINELPCKACYRGLGCIPGFQEERSLFSFPQLVAHFSRAHVGDRSGSSSLAVPPLDWLTDMLLLPQPSALSDMVNSVQGKASQFLSEAVQDFLSRPENTALAKQTPREPNGPGKDLAPNHGGASTAQAGKGNGHNNKDVAHAAYMQRQRSGNGKKPGPFKTQTGQDPKKKNGGTNGPPGQGKQPPESETNQEKEKRKQEQAIRAMWAADRAPLPKAHDMNPPKAVTTASRNPKSASDTGAKQKNREPRQKGKMTEPPARKPAVSIKHEPQEHNQLSTRNIPTRNTAAQEEEGPDLLGALEMHLNGAPAYRPPVSRDEPGAARGPARVVYVDERGREVISRRDSHRDSRGHPHDDDPYGRYAVDERGEPSHRRLQSPPDYPGSYGPVPKGPYGQYRERSPLPARRYADEPVYAGRPRDYEYMYEHGPRQPSSSYQYTRAPPRQEHHQGYADEVGRGVPMSRPVEYEPFEAYEVVRVVDPEGDYYARRPVRRELPQADHRAPELYYSSSASAAPLPYEDASGRAMTRREYAEGYSVSGYGARHDLYVDSPMQGRRPGGAETRRSGREKTAAPPPSTQRPVARADPAYYDEYDPRDPTAGPGSTTGNAGAAPMQGGGRRQIRYQ